MDKETIEDAIRAMEDLADILGENPKRTRMVRCMKCQEVVSENNAHHPNYCVG